MVGFFHLLFALIFKAKADQKIALKSITDYLGLLVFKIELVCFSLKIPQEFVLLITVIVILKKISFMVFKHFIIM